MFKHIKLKNEEWFLFFTICLIKILATGLFSSGYKTEIFIPFVNYYIKNFQNPWDYFYAINSKISFPYPPLMLYLLSPMALILKVFGIENTFLTGAMFSIPLLISDIVILLILFKFLEDKKKEILFLYFLNPIIIYSSYMHGQLDLIPTSLTLYSIWSLKSSRFYRSAFFLGLALASKFHIALLLPFFLIYIYKKNQFDNLSIRKIFYFLFVVVGVFVLLSFPYIQSEKYLLSVHFNKEQFLIFEAFIGIGKLKLYIVPVILAALMGRFLFYRKINLTLFITFLTLIFTSLLILVDSSPGWHVWSLPLIIYLLLKNLTSNQRVFLLIFFYSVSYLVYYVLFYTHPIAEFYDLSLNGTILDLKIRENLVLTNISFTVLAISLLYLAFNVYKYGVMSNSLYPFRDEAFLIGLGGDSSSGKSTLLNDIRTALGANNIITLEGDDDHKWVRGSQEWDNFTHLSPYANEIYKQASHLISLKNGGAANRKTYNHENGGFDSSKLVTSRHFIALSGLHALYLPKIRKEMHLKIFMSTNEELRTEWKIDRDKKERGYSEEKILDSMKKRELDSIKHIQPQKKYADLLFSYYKKNEELKLRIECSAEIDISELENMCIKNEKAFYFHDYSEDLNKQVLLFEQGLLPHELHEIFVKTVKNYDEILESSIVWESGLRGIAQLFVLFEISEKMKAV